MSSSIVIHLETLGVIIFSTAEPQEGIDFSNLDS